MSVRWPTMLGFVGSCTVCVGGLFIDRGLSLLGLNLSRGFWIAMAGLLLMVAAWVWIYVLATRRVVEFKAIMWILVVWAVPFLAAPPLFSGDGYVYAAMSVVTSTGQDPYQPPWVLPPAVESLVFPRWLHLPMPYGPAFFSVASVFGTLTHSAYGLVLMHRALALLGVGLIVWSLPKLASWSGVDPVKAAVLALLNPLLVVSGVAGLHLDVLGAGLAGVALVIGVEKNLWLGLVLGGVAAALKLPFGLICLPIVLANLTAVDTMLTRAWTLTKGAVVAAGTLIALGLVSGFGAAATGTLQQTLTEGSPLSWSTSLTLLFGDSVNGGNVRLVILVLAPLLLIWLAFTLPAGAAAATKNFVACYGVLLIVSPYVQPWYVVLILPALAAVHLGTRGVGALILASAMLAAIQIGEDGWEVVVPIGMAIYFFAGPIALLPAGRRWLLNLCELPGVNGNEVTRVANA